MNGFSVVEQVAWLYLAGPCFVAAGVVAAFRLRFAPFRRWGRAWRAFSSLDREALGALTPRATWVIAWVAAYGAAGALGAANAVAMGGAGVMAWLWVAVIAAVPLRYVAAFLARTRTPGDRSASTGSLARRLRGEGPRSRLTGAVLSSLVLLASFAFISAIHGHAVVRVAEQVGPDEGRILPWALILAALIAIALGPRRSGTALAVVTSLSVLALLGLGSWVALSQPHAFLEALGTSVGQMLGGAPSARPWSGTSARETFEAAVLGFLPPLAVATTIEGSLHSLARAPHSRGQAAAAGLAPLLYVAVGSLLAAAIVASGAYRRNDDGSLPLSSTVLYRGTFDTASQRVEARRRYSGYVRVQQGRASDPEARFAAPRAPIDGARAWLVGAPADIALQVDQGRIVRFLVKEGSLLRQVPVQRAAEVMVRGEMPPVGARLIRTAFRNGTSSNAAATVGLVALLFLAWAATVAWSWGAPLTLPVEARRARRFAALVPPLGLAVAAFPLFDGWTTFGSVVGAVLTIFTAITLALRSGEAS